MNKNQKNALRRLLKVADNLEYLADHDFNQLVNKEGFRVEDTLKNKSKEMKDLLSVFSNEITPTPQLNLNKRGEIPFYSHNLNKEVKKSYKILKEVFKE